MNRLYWLNWATSVLAAALAACSVIPTPSSGVGTIETPTTSPPVIALSEGVPELTQTISTPDGGLTLRYPENWTAAVLDATRIQLQAGVSPVYATPSPEAVFYSVEIISDSTPPRDFLLSQGVSAASLHEFPVGERTGVSAYDSVIHSILVIVPLDNNTLGLLTVLFGDPNYQPAAQRLEVLEATAQAIAASMVYKPN